MSENRKMYLDKFDIAKRYDISINVALGIIRAIRFFNGGGALPRGKILPRELENWESRDEFNRRVFLPYSQKIPAELVRYTDPTHPKEERIDERREEFVQVACAGGAI